jgi:hypothetical protein
MPAATDKLHRIRQPSAAGTGFRLANTLIMSVPTRAGLTLDLAPTCGRREPGSGGHLSLPGRGGDGTSVSRLLARGALAGLQVPAPTPIRCCLPADNRTASLLPVHKRVDDLCATAPSLCIDGGNAGDSAA